MRSNNSQKKKLNLGCGTDIRDDCINLDISKLPGVDVVHDLNRLPLPFEDGQFQEIIGLDVIEHVDSVPVMLKELHRILQPGGVLTLRIPHFTSRNNFVDPTHKHMFSVFTFDFFVKDSPRDVFAQESKWKRNYYFDFHFSTLKYRRITFERPGNIHIFFFIEWFVNLSPTIQKIYEATFIRCLFPAENILVTIRK